MQIFAQNYRKKGNEGKGNKAARQRDEEETGNNATRERGKEEATRQRDHKAIRQRLAAVFNLLTHQLVNFSTFKLS
jgi:hypothetical protein